MHPYPTEFPTADVWQMVSAALRGTVPDPKEAAHAAWHIAGWGLAYWDVHNEVAAAGNFAAPDNEAVAVMCDAMARGVKMAFPWQLVLPVLLRLLEKLLG